MKPIITLALACILAACATEVPAYRWHRTGASESDVSRQINVCKSQAQHDAKHGRESKSLEQWYGRSRLLPLRTRQPLNLERPKPKGRLKNREGFQTTFAQKTDKPQIV